MQDRSRKKKPEEKDENQLAAGIVAQATGEDTVEENDIKKAAAVLGRLGGKKGGPARAKSLSSKRRRQIAIKAAKTRWSKAKKE